MRLSQSFYRLPVRFDAEALQREALAFGGESWVNHPNGIGDNSAIRLITVGGGENDDVDGVMQATPHLQKSPYLRQVLASLGVVWSRSRLMRLGPHAEVPEHADINYHWYYRVRVHIPIITHPSVLFRCGDEAIHMAAGEAWIFDNWRRHSVVNPHSADRIHLVADTAGSSSFWQFVAQGQRGTAPHAHRYDPAHAGVQLQTERTRLAPVMAPAEVDLLLLDLRAELAAADSADAMQRLAQYAGLLDAFRHDWRQIYTVHGEGADGWPQYADLRRRLRDASRELSDGLSMRTNRVGAHKVLEGRVLRVVLPAVPETALSSAPSSSGAAPVFAAAAAPSSVRLRRPIFIIAAPRSGSTLLFETLASSEHLVTLGGEAHWLVEDIESLRPDAPRVGSNRLTAAHATDHVAREMHESIELHLRDAGDRRVALRAESRLLEKTPKNALRIPFFNQLFPDALFVFLWRDPRENLSSIIEAWRSGRWKTYNGLPGFEGPWSMLLPPGWQAMNGKSVEEIAAFQWSKTNRIALDDLAQLDPGRWMSLSHASFLANPQREVERICRFIGIGVDARLRLRLEHPLPLSRYTQTPPEKDKWRRNDELIEHVLPSVENVWQRLRALS
jgi:Sulfotransferase family/Aspartyl/Asparaginyl beta-hydroxylase